MWGAHVTHLYEITYENDQDLAFTSHFTTTQSHDHEHFSRWA